MIFVPMRKQCVIGLFLASFLLLSFHQLALDFTDHDHGVASECHLCQVFAKISYIDHIAKPVQPIHFIAVIAPSFYSLAHCIIKAFNYECRAPPQAVSR